MSKTNFWEAVKQLKGNEFKIFIVIKTLGDNDIGYCFATNKGISDKVGLKPDTISRSISSLKKKDFLHTIEIGKVGNYVDERRIYTADKQTNYRRDSKKDDLIPTSYEVVEGIPIFYNEDNPKGNSNKESIGCLSYKGIGYSSHRGIGQKSYGNGSKLNTSKLNKQNPEIEKRDTLIGKIFSRDKTYPIKHELEHKTIEELENILNEII